MARTRSYSTVERLMDERDRLKAAIELVTGPDGYVIEEEGLHILRDALAGNSRTAPQDEGGDAEANSTR